MVTLLSLGAGVQSSTLAMMAAHGEVVPTPEAAIFADTQGEPKEVYIWLDWLEKHLPYPAVRVTKGNLAKNSVRVTRSKKSGLLYMKRLIPCYVMRPDGKKGMMGRTCTFDYKVEMIIREARKWCGWKRGEKRKLVDMLIGISMDEIIRMKPSRNAFIENRWPLVDLKMTRQDCFDWWDKNDKNYKSRPFRYPPRSACTFCPFHSDEEWLRIKSKPEEWAFVVQYEKELQQAARSQEAMDGIPFLHESCKPIDEVDFSRGLPTHYQVSKFGNECEGLCGV